MVLKTLLNKSSLFNFTFRTTHRKRAKQKTLKIRPDCPQMALNGVAKRLPCCGMAVAVGRGLLGRMVFMGVNENTHTSTYTR